MLALCLFQGLLPVERRGGGAPPRPPAELRQLQGLFQRPLPVVHREGGTPPRPAERRQVQEVDIQMEVSVPEGAGAGAADIVASLSNMSAAELTELEAALGVPITGLIFSGVSPNPPPPAAPCDRTSPAHESYSVDWYVPAETECCAEDDLSRALAPRHTLDRHTL